MDGAARAVLITGPTASGKSALALDLAERIGGTVINADSMQVYRELRILTARPTPEDEARAPHLLYGHVPLAEGYSVGRWLADAAEALTSVRREGRMPIFVGGTGLYFHALTRGLSSMPDISQAVRDRVRARMAECGPAALHEELRLRDPDTAARLAPSDPQRIARALEVIEDTGRSLSEWQEEPAEEPLVRAGEARYFVLLPDRDRLRARIAARFERMLALGVLDEVREVMRLGLDPALPGYRAHGLRPLIAHLRGEITLAEAAERTTAETRQYAKRQFTWLRQRMADWEPVDPGL